jgi:hypothetical protein
MNTQQVRCAPHGYAKGPCDSVGSSNDSPTDAEMLLAARLRLNAAERTEPKKPHGEPYYGPEKRLEEEIECALARNVDALVTRNHYGCLVLNASHALFMDVDVFAPDEIYNPIQGREDRLRPLRHEVLSDLRTVLQSEADYGFRIYQTAGGFRILATTHEFEPGSKQAERLMDAVGSDRDFVELCRKQRNFRARLSPKPWRVGLRRSPNFFPRRSAKAEKRFQNWLAEYDQISKSRATCEYVGNVGREYVHDLIRPVVEFHDRETKALSSLPLA